MRGGSERRFFVDVYWVKWDGPAAPMVYVNLVRAATSAPDVFGRQPSWSLTAERDVGWLMLQLLQRYGNRKPVRGRTVGVTLPTSIIKLIPLIPKAEPTHQLAAELLEETDPRMLYEKLLIRTQLVGEK